MRRHMLVPAAIVLMWPLAAVACPPPPIYRMEAPDRAPDEDDAAYFDRLAAMRMEIVPPPQALGESAEQFAARVAIFNQNLQRAAELRQQREIAAARAARLREENDRWASAGQVILAEVVARSGNVSDQIRLRVIDRFRGERGPKSISLTYGGYTSCGPYPPDFAVGERYVLFAPPGPVNSTTLIGHYGLAWAQDERTRRWISGTRPDGTPVPTRRQNRR